MRKVRYGIATSLDGYIAGPRGEADWIITDPDIDFRAIFEQFDTFLIGRRTYETMASAGRGETPGFKTYVFSRTLKQQDHPGVTIVSENAEQTISGLRLERGKDIWLFGGGSLFNDLLAAQLVDTIEVSIIPILLGGGTALLPPPAESVTLNLTSHKIYKTGIVSLKYDIEYSSLAG